VPGRRLFLSTDAGVLDGGAAEVLMNGKRLAKFMQSVDEVAGAMGVAEEAERMPAQPSAAALSAATPAQPQPIEAAGAPHPDAAPPIRPLANTN